MLKERFRIVKSWIARHPRRFAVYIAGGILAGVIIFQFLYPTGTLVPYSSVENVPLGGVSKAEAIKKLDDQYAKAEVSVSFKDSKTTYLSSPINDLGIKASNKDRIEGMDYPWYLRLVPSSVLWVHYMSDITSANPVQRNQEALGMYIGKTFGENCHLDAKNATISVKDNKMVVNESSSGGDCTLEEVTKTLSTVQPSINGAKVTISGKEIKPTVTTEAAEKFVDHVSDVIKDGVTINDGKQENAVPRDTLVSWIDFVTTNEAIDYSFNAERASGYLNEKIAAAVSKPAGVVTITTHDFTETSRVPGANGAALDEAATLNSIKVALEKGEKTVSAGVKAVAPTPKYIRTYSSSDVGLSALMKNYAETHPGTYGVSLRELSGQRRNAGHRASTQYTTASTYKLFVGYSSLLKVESGAWQWSDQIQGGKDLTRCFSDMIRLSDNPCAEALLSKIGFKQVTNDARAIGAVNTSFLGSDSIKSTAEDESLLLSLLATGQLLNQQANRDTWINALKANVYRKGVPAGIPSATVANKVGFLDAFLHDAAIVYSPSGTYVLTILTENASWANIAELTAEIEKLRTS